MRLRLPGPSRMMLAPKSALITVFITAVVLAACHSSHPTEPSGIFSDLPLDNRAQAESTFTAAQTQLFDGLGAYDGLIAWGGLLSDEFSWSAFTILATDAGVDARMTAANGGFVEPADSALVVILSARSSLLLAAAGLERYEPSNGRSLIGEAFALAGYAEVMLAEDYCAGIPLSSLSADGGGVTYGSPNTTDSLLGAAETHFDSALANANGNDTVISLADIGLGRERLDRGVSDAANAAAAVSGVPTSFVYNMTLLSIPPSNGNWQSLSLYASGFEPGCGWFNVSNNEGTNGLPFLRSHDPRLVVDSTSGQTCDEGTWYYPTRFGSPTTGLIPLATGVEARLIEAEAALAANSISSWLADLNVLRAGSCVANTDTVCTPGEFEVPGQPYGLVPLSDPGTPETRVATLFQERAYWLFGAGSRLGDLRRLSRQYNQPINSTYPAGTYSAGPTNQYQSSLPSPIPNYGNDVSLTIPASSSNAALGPASTYRGCIVPTSAA